MEPAIIVQNVTKTFKLPHERVSSIKGMVVNFYRQKKSYETQKALEDVSFQVEKGDFFAIVGRNGSGKSTLLKMLAGIYIPTKGDIAVHGKLTPFIELGVGFNPDLTGRENVFLNGALLGFTRKEMEAKYDDIVEFAEIERFMDQKLKNYSSGMQVRLAFSIAIRAKGDILLLDEVLAVGDSAFQQKCYNYFEELKAQKRTVVFVSHDMSAVRRFCTKAVYIDNGKLTLQGTPAEIADAYELANIDNGSKAKGDDGLSKSHSISTTITEQTKDTLVLDIAYASNDDEALYTGIAVLKGGVSVAEINTVGQLDLSRKGHITYSLDTSMFNGGRYEIGSGLFRLKNKELLAIGDNKSSFVIKGSDDTKGGALKLNSTWEHK
jgi:ABC-2 type transport system ATP-binding protein